jgi:hypothetical protein
MFIIDRYGEENKMFNLTNENFNEIVNPQVSFFLIDEKEDSLFEYCYKVNENFKQYSLDCGIYPQMQIDQLINRVNECFKIICPQGVFVKV